MLKKHPESNEVMSKIVRVYVFDKGTTYFKINFHKTVIIVIVRIIYKKRTNIINEILTKFSNLSDAQNCLIFEIMTV